MSGLDALRLSSSGRTSERSEIISPLCIIIVVSRLTKVGRGTRQPTPVVTALLRGFAAAVLCALDLAAFMPLGLGLYQRATLRFGTPSRVDQWLWRKRLNYVKNFSSIHFCTSNISVVPCSTIKHLLQCHQLIRPPSGSTPLLGRPRVVICTFKTAVTC